MNAPWNRRQVLKTLAGTSAALTLPRGATGLNNLPQHSSSDREIHITSLSEHTVKLSVLPITNGKTAPIPLDGSLVQTSWGEPIARLRGNPEPQELKAGELSVHVSARPIAFTISTRKGSRIQQLEVDPDGNVSFATGNSPLLGLGEGGPQFDRRGSADPMISGQGGVSERTADAFRSLGSSAPRAGRCFSTNHLEHSISPGLRANSIRQPHRRPRHFLCALSRPAGHHGRVRADDRSRGNAPGVELRISAVPSHPRQR